MASNSDTTSTSTSDSMPKAQSKEQKSNHPLPDFASLALPTEQRTAQASPDEFRKIHSVGFGYEEPTTGGGAANARHDAEYYAGWRAEQAEKVARGENPYDDFAKRARERSDDEPLPRMLRKIGKVFSKGKEKKSADAGIEGRSENDGVVR